MMLVPSNAEALNKDYNPLVFDFVLKRTMRDAFR